MSLINVSISTHTTKSLPRPHIVYFVDIRDSDETRRTIPKRYSEFIDLKKELGDPFELPPKRLLVTTFVPSAWVDDDLIAERKTGLVHYLEALLHSSAYASHEALVAFLSGDNSSTKASVFDPEDALPSTLPRKAGIAAQQVLAEAATPLTCSYYPSWSVYDRPPESIDFSKFDILFYAFATPSSSNGLNWDSGSTSVLKRLVAAAKASGKGTKVVLSVGGWGGCYYFSHVMSSSANRGQFITALTNAVKNYGLAGIDIDWEYPNSPGAGQPYSSADAANLLTFFTYLRKSLGSSAIISSAVPHLPWLGSNGSPLKNVSSYAAQMTFVNIMNYDVWGASSSPGPNAPLDDLCGTSDQPQANAQAAIKQWTAAGFPKNKLMLGLPLYGYVSKSSKTVLTGSYKLPGPPPSMPPSAHTERLRACPLPIVQEQTEIAASASTEAVAEPPTFLEYRHDRTSAKSRTLPRSDIIEHNKVSIEAAGDLGSYFGSQIAFNQLVSLGALKKSGSAYVGANGYTHAWDDCSDTPFLFNKSRSTVVTYDDTYSLADKSTFAKSQGLAGVFTWSLDQDDGYALQNVIRTSVGK